MIKSIQYVYDHLVCEFNHWDICISGLLSINDKYYYCKIINSDDPDEYNYEDYEIFDINWTEECQEYLDDYRVAYKHWFYENRKRSSYNGWLLKWFSDKWDKRNPIKENIINV